MADEPTLLLVEDNDLDAERIARTLKRIACPREMRRVRHGGEALEMLKKNLEQTSDRRAFLVLLDLNMPKVNGLEFLAALRNDEPIASTPVVVLTTSQLRRDIDEAYRYNIAGFLIKPVDTQSLETLLRTANDYWGLSEHPSLASR